ncbi:MAG: hypothetical protein AAGE03_01720 [Pseudomonadota bacterium]
MPHSKPFVLRLVPRQLGLAVLAAAGLASCNTPVGTEVTRATARSVVNPIVAERFPGVPLQPTTDCIINNASSDEILTLAASAATQDEQTAVRTVLNVAQRPDTVQCIASDGLPVLLNTF